MKINDVDYGDTSKINPKTNISIKNFNMLLRMLALMSLNISSAFAKPLSMRRFADTNLIYNNFQDPSMPIPPYYNSYPSGWEVFNYPFVVHNSSSALVVAGDHTKADEPYSGTGGMHDSIVDSVFRSVFGLAFEEGGCFNYEKLVAILEAIIGEISATTPVNYMETACIVKNYQHSGYRYDAQVYGLTESDCALFIDKYNAQVDTCHDLSKIIIALFFVLVVLAALLMVVVMTGFGVSCFKHYRDARVLNLSTATLPAYQNLDFAAPSINPTVSSINTSAPANILLSNTPGIDSNLKEYLISIEKSDIRLEKLTIEDHAALAAANKDLCCPITSPVVGALELMDMPVMVGGNAFEFSNILALQVSGELRKHPLRSEAKYQFRLDQVQPAIEKRAAIVNLIQKNLKPASERTSLLPRLT